MFNFPPNPVGGQPSSSTPFGSSSNGTTIGSVFGGFNNGTPSGSPFGLSSKGTPFGSPSGESISSSPFSSITSFGVLSSRVPAFGSSMPAFSASSTPAFGAPSTPAFGAPSAPAFGGPSAPAFGAPSAPAFGAPSAPAFGAPSAPAFGAPSGPAFGAPSGPAFGAPSAPAFGAPSAPAFGAPSAPAFGAPSAPAFGAPSAPAFGAPSAPAFGAPSAPAFGAPSAPAFSTGTISAFSRTSVGAFAGTSNSPVSVISSPAFGGTSSTFGVSNGPSLSTSASGHTGFNFNSFPIIGQRASAFANSNSHGSTPLFQTQKFPSGFGHSVVDGESGGSRVACYVATLENDGSNAKIESLCAMKSYIKKSHEELRFEDYQSGDKGGRRHDHSSSSVARSNTSFFPSAPIHSNPFAPRIPSVGPLDGTNPFQNPFTSSMYPNISSPEISSVKCFGTQESLSGIGNGGSRVTSYTETPEEYGNKLKSISAMPAYMNKSHEELRFEDYHLGDKGEPKYTNQFFPEHGVFSSTTNSHVPSLNNFPLNVSAPNFSFSGFNLPPKTFPSLTPFLKPSPSDSSDAWFSFPKTTPAPDIFSGDTPSRSAINPQQPNIFQPSAPINGPKCALCQPITTPSSIQPNMLHPSPVNPNQGGNLSSSTQDSGSSEAVKAVGGESLEGQQLGAGSTEEIQQSPVTNPFGTEKLLQISIDRPEATISIQYGISSIPVSDNPTPVRRSSLLRVPRLSLRRNWSPPQKYDAKSDGSKVPFFKADVSFIPRENPRSWGHSPSKEGVLRADYEKSSEEQSTIVNLYENGNIALELSITGPSQLQNQHTDEISGETKHEHDGKSSKEENMNVKAADIEAVMPKLQHADYYTEPSIQELAAKEKAEPGFCRRVKDFVIGRHGFGSIKFLGETDIRKLDLDSHVQFSNRMVEVYVDEGNRPPIGEGLNKPAEVILLNVKCIGKKSGKQYTDGAKVDQYREMLIKKGTEQGAEFISYDPVLGEWKFKVQHF